MSVSKDKGTKAETAVVGCARHSGFPLADRLTLTGRNDRGDVGLCPGVICEVKADKSLDVAGWLKETATEKVNANAAVAFLAIKPEGVGYSRVEDWLSVMYLGDWGDLVLQAEPDHRPWDIGEPVSGRTYKSALKELARSRTWEGPLIIRPIGADNDRYWYVVTRLHQQFELLRRAGYGREVLV